MLEMPKLSVEVLFLPKVSDVLGTFYWHPIFLVHIPVIGDRATRVRGLLTAEAICLSRHSLQDCQYPGRDASIR